MVVEALAELGVAVAGVAIAEDDVGGLLLEGLAPSPPHPDGRCASSCPARPLLELGVCGAVQGP